LKRSHQTTATVLLANFLVFTQLTTNLRRMCKSRFICVYTTDSAFLWLRGGCALISA